MHSKMKTIPKENILNQGYSWKTHLWLQTARGAGIRDCFNQFLHISSSWFICGTVPYLIPPPNHGLIWLQTHFGARECWDRAFPGISACQISGTQISALVRAAWNCSIFSGASFQVFPPNFPFSLLCCFLWICRIFPHLGFGSEQTWKNPGF